MKRLIIGSSLFLLLVPIIVVSQGKITDMFIASTYALAQKTFNVGFYQVEPYQIGIPVGNWDWQGHANGLSYYPVTAIIYVILSLVSGIPINVLVFIPFGIIFLLIAFLALIRGLLRNKFFIFAYLLIQVLYLRFVYSLSYQILGYFFHTLALVVLFKMLSGELKVSYFSLILFLVLGSASLTYYTASAWNLVFLAATIVLLVIFKLRKKNIKNGNQKINCTLSFTLFTAVLYFLIDRQFYKYITERSITETLANFVNYVGFRLSGLHYATPRKRYGIYEYDPLGRILSYFPLAMILFSITYTLISLLITIKSKNKTLTSPLVMFAAVIICGIFENIAYFSYTQDIGNRYFQMFGLLICFFAFEKFLSKKQRKSSKKLLLFISTAALTILMLSSAFYNAYYGVFRGNVAIRFEVPALCRNTSNWLASHVGHGNIVSEHQVSGFLFMDIIKANKSDSTRVFPLNEDIYAIYESIAQSDEKTLSKLFAIRTYSLFVYLKIFDQKPMFGDVWGYAVPPLNERENNLYNFTIFNKICDDGNAVILNYNR
jgi:hypothetical protein